MTHLTGTSKRLRLSEYTRADGYNCNNTAIICMGLQLTTASKSKSAIWLNCARLSGFNSTGSSSCGGEAIEVE